MTGDVPLTVIGGRGPHGLALHLWMQDRGLGGYRLVDPAPHWLPLYGPSGPMQAVAHLRSPRELDFALGDEARAMTRFADDDGSYPLANVYSLSDAERRAFNEATTERDRAPRLAFWRYANALARRSGADAYHLAARVERLEPLTDGWRVHLAGGRSFCTAAVIVASGLLPHLRIPKPWQVWWYHLPDEVKAHALRFDYARERLAGKRVAVLGSSNLATWEAAIRAAEEGAKVTLLSRALNPIEWQLPFPAHWFREAFVRTFMALPDPKRLKILKKTHIPNTALPGMARRAEALGVRIRHYARVQYATPLWGGVQVLYRTTAGEHAEHFDLLLAATGVLPQLKELACVADAARERRAPVVVGGPARHRPILDEEGRWKNLPPLYPMGAHALMRGGLAVNTLASATVYLPLLLPQIVERVGIAHTRLRAAG
jgi:hypothetical protein